MSRDERRVLALLAVRLRQGRRVYGPLHLARDRRDFRVEALEEVLDLALYVAMALLKASGSPASRIRGRKRGALS